MSREFKFRPRYRGIAILAAVTGVGLCASGILIAEADTGFAFGAGAAGILLSAAYFLSPVWRLSVVVDDAGLEVRRSRKPTFRLDWIHIKAVIAAPESKTCFVDGGSPENSLLVPGPGAPASYEIVDSAELFDLILANVDKARTQLVSSLREHQASQ